MFYLKFYESFDKIITIRCILKAMIDYLDSQFNVVLH